MRYGAILRLAAFAFVAAAPTQAKLTSSGPSGFTVMYQVELPGSPEQVYAKFLRIGEWWSDEHTFSAKASNMTITTVPGGCWCETLPSGFVQHMEVVSAIPGDRLVMTGGLGPLQAVGVAATMSLTLVKGESGTTAVVTYVVGGYGVADFKDMGSLVDSVLQEGMDRFKAYAAAP